MAELDSKLKQIDRVINAFNSEAVTNEDFEEKMKRVLELVKQLVQNNAEAIKKIQTEHQVLLREVSKNHDTSLSELKSQTNQLFVGERLDSINKGQREAFQALQGTIDERMSTVKSGDDGKTPTRDELVALMVPLVPKSPDLTKIKETIVKILEDHKKMKSAISKAAGNVSGKVVAGPNVNAVNFVDLSDQCNGSTKTFFVPTFRKVLALHGTQFPFLYRPTTDFTLGNKTLTLTDEVAPPESGQSLILTYIK